MTDSRFDVPGDATVPAGSDAGDSRLSGAELRALLGDTPGENFSEYSDRKLLGLGGMGAVYSGTETGLNRHVAIKILRPQYRYSAERIESFIREARLTARIDHPNIIPVHRFGVFDDAGVYFTMRRIAGNTLSNIIKNIAEDVGDYRRKYSLRTLVGIFLSVCNGVAFAHSKGVLHGDIKPGNIMVGKYGEVMVMDWGLAHDISGEFAPDENLRKALIPEKRDNQNELGGTPAFMAPEHISGEVTVYDKKSEVYALGAMLYSILTLKKTPFEHTSSRRKLAMKILSDRPPLPRKAAPKYRDVPRELEAICLKAMAKDRETRYNDVDELIQDITNYLDGYPVNAYSPLYIYRVQKLIARRPLIPALVLVFLIVSIFFYEWNMLEQRKDIQVKYSMSLNASNQGLSLARTLRQYNRKLRSAGIDSEKRRGIEQLTSGIIIRTANAYDTAFNNFANVPLPMIITDVKLAVSDLIYTARDLNTYDLAREAALGFVSPNDILVSEFVSIISRHRTLVDIALKDMPRLNTYYGKLMSESGTLMLPAEVRSGRWQLDICDVNGRILQSVRSRTQNSELTLAPGRYLLRFSNKKIGTVNMPLVMTQSDIYNCDLKFPGNPIPENMVFIAGTGSNGEVSSFFIRKNEVTIREFIEFWKTLSPEERSAGRVRFFSEKTGSFVPLWDDSGKVIYPYTPDAPVFGVSLAVARQYCAWLGKKLDRPIRLPEYAEWNRAAFSFDSDGNSAYGVTDLNRNVRELLASKSSGVFNRNIGFRYVMDLNSK